MILARQYQCTERVKSQRRAEFFNLWKWNFFSEETTWDEGGAFFNDWASLNFGLLTADGTAPRNIQLGAKIALRYLWSLTSSKMALSINMGGAILSCVG